MSGTVWYRDEPGVIGVLSGNKFYSENPYNDDLFEGEFADELDIGNFLLEHGWICIGDL